MDARRSAAVLVHRGGGAELLLVERAAQLAFYGGFHAAPGGVLDVADARASEEGDERALRRCALRELFEETGIAPGGLDLGAAGARRELRRGLLAGTGPGTSSAAWNARLDAAPAVLDELRHVCRLTTPPFAARRYRTDFFELALPPEGVLDIWPGELTSGRFAAVGDTLAAWRRGELRIVPPVLSLLEMWNEARAAEDFPAGFLSAARDAAASMQAGALRLSRNSPGIGFVALATPTLPPATTTNCYVVGVERVFIVDPATHDEGERARLFVLLDALRAQGVELAGVLVTHHHADHVGSVAAVAERYGLPVCAHPLTLARLPCVASDARPLDDGARLELGSAPDGSPGWFLEVLHTPGHDRGHLVFRESRYGALLAGDLVSTLSTIVIDPPEGHLATYLATLERVRARGVGMVYPAHGPPHPEGARLLAGYLRHRARREAKLVGALGSGSHGSGSHGLDELLREVYDDVDARLLGVARRSLVAGLEKLMEEGRAREQDGGWALIAAAGEELPNG